MSTNPAAQGIAGPNHCKYCTVVRPEWAIIGGCWGGRLEPYDNNTDRAEQSTAA